MRKFSRALIFGAVLLGCSSCTLLVPRFNFPRHDPDTAAAGAIYFAKEAFIDLNQPAAYALLSEELRRNASFDKYISVITWMHPDGFPKEIVAADYMPAPGADAVLIWMQGEGNGERFYYRLVMRREGGAGYRIAEMIRADSYPRPGSVTPLPQRRSTASLR